DLDGDFLAGDEPPFHQVRLENLPGEIFCHSDNSLGWVQFLILAEMPAASNDRTVSRQDTAQDTASLAFPWGFCY
ncbi:MAG TPA: hypothetical protein VIA07_09165, partial [Desulfuromonadales bacterium]